MVNKISELHPRVWNEYSAFQCYQTELRSTHPCPVKTMW